MRLSRARKALYAARASLAKIRAGGRSVITENVMGKFDSRNTQKMGRRKRQEKLKARLKRKAAAVKATRTKKPAGKKKSA